MLIQTWTHLKTSWYTLFQNFQKKDIRKALLTYTWMCVFWNEKQKLTITVWIGKKKRNLFWPFLFKYTWSAWLEKVAEIYVVGWFQMLLNSLNRGKVGSKKDSSFWYVQAHSMNSIHAHSIPTKKASYCSESQT